MEHGEEPNIDDAIRDIAGLLAEAYRRRARLRLVPSQPGPLPSTELANSGEQSVHELTLTRRRKESAS